jgi:acyl carrier protein|nr:acyl carrier protein [uncultured Psychroserpens sp.]
MDQELLNKLKEILEEDVLDLSLSFKDFDEWDSLTSLSLIAMVDSDYKITITNKLIEGFENVAAFCDYITNHEG